MSTLITDSIFFIIILIKQQLHGRITYGETMNSVTYCHGSHTFRILDPISLYQALTNFIVTWAIYVVLINV